MQRPPVRPRISAVCVLNRSLASVVIMVRMTMTPIPVGALLFHSEFEEWVVLPVRLAEVQAVGMIFVVVPIVVILVVAVADAIAIVVATPLFLRKTEPNKNRYPLRMLTSSWDKDSFPKSSARDEYVVVTIGIDVR